jgi:hypothetical protein
VSFSRPDQRQRHHWRERRRTRAWWTATDPVFSGAIRKSVRSQAGRPDVAVLYRGKLIGIELKSRSGRCTPTQRPERKAILRAGGAVVVHEDGTIERWQRPELPAWKVPPRAPKWKPAGTA